MRPLTAVTLTIALTALWLTRDCWHIPWERAAVINVALQAFKLVFVIPPLSLRVGPKVYAWTGVWNLEELVGHLGYIVGMFSLLFLVSSRLEMTPREWRSFVRYRIELPAVLAISTMSAIFVAGTGRGYIPDTVRTTTTTWLRAYFLTDVAVDLFILVQVVQALLVLRGDRRSRKVATAYLLAVSVSLACCAAFLLELEQPAWWLIRFETIGYAAAAVYSWRSKVYVPPRVPA